MGKGGFRECVAPAVVIIGALWLPFPNSLLLTIFFTPNLIVLHSTSPNQMSKYEFAMLCLEYGIAPSIALENKEVELAVLSKDIQQVREALENNF